MDFAIFSSRKETISTARELVDAYEVKTGKFLR